MLVTRPTKKNLRPLTLDGAVSGDRPTNEEPDPSTMEQGSLLAQGHQSSTNAANNVDTVTNGVQQNTAKEENLRSSTLDGAISVNRSTVKLEEISFDCAGVHQVGKID